jgi:hypothetical protein
VSGTAYLDGILAKYELKQNFVASVAAGIVADSLRLWANVWLIDISYVGSRAKGTGITGTTDLDIFISLKPDTPHTLEDIYERLFLWATSNGWLPRRQNVSVGINYLGVKIDLVPGRRQDGFIDYHSLWKRKAKTWAQTAPGVHVSTVRDSGRTREIRAIKIWRQNHKVDFPSFYLELTVLDALRGCGWDLERNVQRALGYIAEHLETSVVVDPANTANVVSEELTAAEKEIIAEQATRSFDEKSWIPTLW